MFLSFGEEGGRTAILEGTNDVVRGHCVPSLVAGERCIQILNCELIAQTAGVESSFAHKEAVLEGSGCSLRLRVDLEANRAELHLGDGVMAVAELRRCGETQDVAGSNFAGNALKLDGWKVMTLVDNELAIVGYEIRDGALAHEALEHGEGVGRASPSRAAIAAQRGQPSCPGRWGLAAGHGAQPSAPGAPPRASLRPRTRPRVDQDVLAQPRCRSRASPVSQSPTHSRRGPPSCDPRRSRPCRGTRLTGRPQKAFGTFPSNLTRTGLSRSLTGTNSTRRHALPHRKALPRPPPCIGRSWTNWGSPCTANQSTPARMTEGTRSKGRSSRRSTRRTPGRTGSTQPWLGHDPAPWVEPREGTFFVWPDGSLDQNVSKKGHPIVFTADELREALRNVGRDFAEFSTRLDGWLRSMSVPTDRIVAQFHRAFVAERS